MDHTSSLLDAMHKDATAPTDAATKDQDGLYDPSSQAFVKNDVDSVIELLEIYQQRLNENFKVMKELYHRRQSMMAKVYTEYSESLPLPNGGASLSLTGSRFGGSGMDAFRYRIPEGLDMDIPRHAEILDAAPVYEAAAQQQALAALSRNTQTSMAEIGDLSLRCREIADYHDRRTATFTPVYAPFPQSDNFDYGHAQEIAFGSASFCLPGQTISHAAFIGSGDNKDGRPKPSVEAQPRDRPTVLSFNSGGIKHYRCECGYESARKGDIDHHLKSLKHSERKYECPCGKKFTRNDSLNRHRKRCGKGLKTCVVYRRAANMTSEKEFYL